MLAAGVIATTGLSAAVIGFGATSASASPVNAKNALSGTFDCGSVGSGTFVVNSGNAQAAVTWNAAHVNFADAAPRSSSRGPLI